MIEETARIVAVEDDAVWLEARRESACGRCALRSGCGHGLLDGMRRSRSLHLRLPRTGALPLEVDDRVVLGIAEGAILRASARMYGLPLSGLVVGALTGEALGGDLLAGILGVTGLVAGLALVALLDRRAPLAVPRILRRLDAVPLAEPRPVSMV
jgi:sigma-E factor negative regulatory protein RseC